MPYFEFEISKDFLKQINIFADSDEVCRSMLAGAVPILVSSVKRTLRGVLKHPSGELERSITGWEPTKWSDGTWHVSVSASGKAKKKLRKSAKVFARSKHGTMTSGRALFNDDKLWMLEHGTSKQSPTPILRTASLNAEKDILEKMQEIFNEELMNGH